MTRKKIKIILSILLGLLSVASFIVAGHFILVDKEMLAVISYAVAMLFAAGIMGVGMFI